MGSRAPAAERARRLLAMLPRLRRGSMRLDELAAVTGTDVEGVAADLVTLSMCGVPPYTPDALVSVLVEGDEVVVWADPPALGGAVRLSDAETQALSAALEAAGVGRDDPRFAPLFESPAPGEDLEEAVRARVLSGAPDDVFAGLALAVAERRAAYIDYFSAASETTTCRDVHPLSLANRGGVWYLTAYCPVAEETRVFRVDRIVRLERTERRFEPPEDVGPADPVPFGPDAFPVASVRFSAGSPGLDTREWPGTTFRREPDGSVLARVPYASARWLARRVVARLGEAEVLDPPEVKENVAKLANTLHGEC